MSGSALHFVGTISQASNWRSYQEAIWPTDLRRLVGQVTRVTEFFLVSRAAQFALGQFEVCFDCQFGEPFELYLRRPTELAPRLRRVTDQQIDFRGTEKSLIDLDLVLPA
jgi:hypothetical protein